MSVKETILNQLENSDTFISGQELADLCKVSRAYIWKTIKALQEQGAAIEAVSNKGYRLINDDIYNGETISKNIEKLNAQSNINILFYPSVDSSNTEAKRLLLENSAQKLHKTVIVAGTQTKGRGRLGRSFYSPVKNGIYFSIIYSPENGFNAGTLTAHAAVGISRAIKKNFNVESGIKWVNDIYINNSKVCGILTEGTTNLETGKIEAAIIGIGINITGRENLPEEIKNTAGTILEKGTVYKRSSFIAQCILDVLEILDGNEQIKKDSIDEYIKRSILIGKEITVTPVINVENGKYKCLVTGISEEAKLIVRLEDGREIYLDSGEVSLHQENLSL